MEDQIWGEVRRRKMKDRKMEGQIWRTMEDRKMQEILKYYTEICHFCHLTLTLPLTLTSEVHVALFSGLCMNVLNMLYR